MSASRHKTNLPSHIYVLRRHQGRHSYVPIYRLAGSVVCRGKHHHGFVIGKPGGGSRLSSIRCAYQAAKSLLLEVWQRKRQWASKGGVTLYTIRQRTSLFLHTNKRSGAAPCKQERFGPFVLRRMKNGACSASAVDDRTAVDVNDLSGHVRRIIGCQEYVCRSQLFRLAGTLHRCVGAKRCYFVGCKS